MHSIGKLVSLAPPRVFSCSVHSFLMRKTSIFCSVPPHSRTACLGLENKISLAPSRVFSFNNNQKKKKPTTASIAPHDLLFFFFFFFFLERIMSCHLMHSCWVSKINSLKTAPLILLLLLRSNNFYLHSAGWGREANMHVPT